MTFLCNARQLFSSLKVRFAHGREQLMSALIW